MNRFRLCGALLLCATSALSIVSHAQETETAPDKVETAQIQLHDAPAPLVAYWLAPGQNLVPIQIQSSRENDNYSGGIADDLPRQPGNALGPRDLKLPDGIVNVISIDPQNVLMVRGTAAGIEALKKLVPTLDVPINQVEIEAQFCQMSSQTLKEFPLQFTATGEEDYAPAMALVPPTLKLGAELNKRIASNKIRVITAPRLTALDGLAANLQSTETRSLILSPLDKKTADVTEPDMLWLPGLSTVQIETGLNCTPVFHGDLIKLFARMTLNNIDVNVTANMRDGETVAIAMPAKKSDADKRTVIFLTARTVRRASDERALAAKASAKKIGVIR